jgi:hypothetical protein
MCADGPVGVDRRPLVLDPHLLIALKPATGQNHTAPGLDQLGLGAFRRGGVTYTHCTLPSSV